MKYTKIPLSLSFVAFLSACGGSSSPDPLSFDDFVDEGVAIANLIEGSDIQETAPGALPTTGSARYVGVAGTTLSDSSEVAGRFTLDADFADNSVSGALSDIVDQDSNPLEGSLTFADGDIDRTSNPGFAVYEADMAGSLTNIADEEFIVDAELIGTFGGENAEFVAGVFAGTATSGDNVLEFDDGEFLGERQ